MCDGMSLGTSEDEDIEVSSPNYSVNLGLSKP
jgi:hypothetical protein